MAEPRALGVRAGYGETVVLEDVDVELPARGSLAVLGRNGVGKTTLLATIMGHTTFHSGQHPLPGCRAIQQKPVYERCRLGIGYVPQERVIFPSLTRAREPRRRAPARALDARARLRACFPRLKERAPPCGNQLSGGEQQMLAIGRALMGNPSLLLLDEPLEGLAPIIVEALLSALKKLVARRVAGHHPGRAARQDRAAGDADRAGAEPRPRRRISARARSCWPILNA